jgi:hypothetical protein
VTRRRTVLDHDAAVVREIVRWGALTVEQLCDARMDAHFEAKSTAYGRMKVLVEFGWLVAIQPFANPKQHFSVTRLLRGGGGIDFPRVTIYLPTWKGTKLVGEPPMSPPSFDTVKRLGWLRNHLLTTDFARWLLTRETAAKWKTHRELLKSAMASAREPSGRLSRGAEHVPTGLLAFPNGQRVAVELELGYFAKPRRAYDRILHFYKARADVDAIRWYAFSEDRAPLTQLVAQAGVTTAIEILPLQRGLASFSPWWFRYDSLLE